MKKLSFIKLFLKEIEAFRRFFWKTPKTEKAIVFYTEHKDYYPYFEGLIEKLTERHKQALCYVTSDPEDPILQRTEPRIKSFYINKLLSFFMVFVDCKVFVMTLTELDRSHLKRSFKQVHYVYVFHAMVSTHMVYRYSAFDHYDSILCCGPHHVEEISRHEKLYARPPKKLVKAGYYRLERIYEKYEKYSSEEPLPAIKKTILIAPSWGAINILEFCGERLIELLLKIGYAVIVRPHPETIRRSPGLIRLFVSKFGNNPDFKLETSVATDTSLLRSDILITDYSGIAIEYAFGTERPVLFLDTPVKIRNKRFRELGIEPIELSLRSKIGVILSPENLETVPQAISGLIRDGAVYKNYIVELRKQYVYNFGYSSEVGTQHILDFAIGKLI